MEKEFTILEGFEQGEKEIELSLELSIGGDYRKTEKSSQDPYRSDYPCVKVDLGIENGFEFVDLNKRREIQALRRQEARKKREGKLKKTISRGSNAEDKLWLQAKQFQCRVGDREIKENENFSAESVRKKEKNGAVNSIDEAAKELNLSLNNGGMEGTISGSNNSGQVNPARWFYPQLQCGHSGSGMNAGKNEVDKSNVFRLGTCSNANSSDSIHGGHNPVSDGSFERNTAVSDYQNIVQKGGSGSNSDTGSNSSNSHVLERLETNVPSAKREQKNGSLNTEKHSMETAPSSITSQISDKPISNTSSEQTTDVRSRQSENGTLLSQSKESNGIHSKPPKPQSQNHMAVSLSRMPCVSTTGNGPNGKTITGFLYKYSRSEVSIMCVCHGSSFSPAEFVEHAGGVDISHPLRHITVVPSAFG